MAVLRATQAIIHLDALAHNFRILRNALGAGVLMCPAVKSDAYGHGILPVARRLRAEGAEFLGVGLPVEGTALRQAGDRGPILLFGYATPQEVPLIFDADLIPFAGNRDYLKLLEKTAKALGRPLPIHLKVDTGMGRLGCRPEEAADLAAMVHSSQWLKLEGLATHFPVADSKKSEDLKFTRQQAVALRRIAEEISSAGIDPGLIHAANSGAVARSPETAFNLARPGIALYGYGPSPGPPLRPVMELVTRVVALKRVEKGRSISYGRTWRSPGETVIATLPLGYGDGYPRLLSNRAEVLVNGERRPVVGRVCMDHVMVDLGAASKVRINDAVTLFGPDPAGPDAAELADLTDTISYEITCGISGRVPRVYRD